MKTVQLSVFLFVLCFSYVRSQYYGYAMYSGSGCVAANFQGYAVFPTGTCTLDTSNPGVYGYGSCGSTITLYANCTSSDCSTCYNTTMKTIDACEDNGPDSRIWQCYSSLPIPATHYYAQYKFSNAGCSPPSSFQQAILYKSGICSTGTVINCTSNAVNLYSCSLTDCANCTTAGSVPTGCSNNNDGTSALLSCDSTVFPSASPSRSPSRSPSATPLPQSPTPTPAADPAYWGYAIYLGSGCQDSDFAGYEAYLDNTCLGTTPEGYFNYEIGSCLGSTITVKNCSSDCVSNCTTAYRSVGTCEPTSGGSIKWQCFNTLPTLAAEYWYEDSQYLTTDCSGSAYRYGVAYANKCFNTTMLTCSGSTTNIYFCESNSQCNNCTLETGISSECATTSTTSVRVSCHSVYDPSPSRTPSPSVSPVADPPYWGYTEYQSIYGCSGDSYYQTFPSHTCVDNQGIWMKGYCSGSQIYFYDNCTDSTCTNCSLRLENSNACDLYDGNYVSWGCYASIPAPSGNTGYVTYQTFGGSTCSGPLYTSLTLSMGCLNSIKYHCDQNHFYVDYCSDNNCTSCSPLETITTNNCTVTDPGISSGKYVCHQASGTSPFPSPPASPSASPSFAPVQNAALWGYTSFTYSNCAGAPSGYTSYAKNTCVYDDGSSTFIKGSCSSDGSAVTTYQCDSSCNNCVQTDMETVNSCVNFGGQSRIYSCWNTAPVPQTPYSVFHAYSNTSTTCMDTPIFTQSATLGCLSGFQEECDGTSVVILQCTNSDCTGTCSNFLATNTTCSYNNVAGYYESTTCHPASSSTTTTTNGGTSSGSTGGDSSASLVGAQWMLMIVLAILAIVV